MTDTDRRFDPHKSRVLLDAQRLAHWDPPHFLARFGLKPGQTIVDLGCGPGFWTLPLAEIAGPEGVVWALDASRELLDALAQRNPPPQVRLRLTELPVVDLPDASVDFIWAAFVFHEVTPAQRLAGEIRRLLGPQGRVAILEWRPDALGQSGPPRRHRLLADQVTGCLKTAGFPNATSTWQDEDTYLIEAK